MELNNKIDPSTGLPRLPDDMYWEITEPTASRLPTLVLVRKVVKNRVDSVKAPRWMNMFGIYTTTKKKESAVNVPVLSRELGESCDRKPVNTKGWTRFDFYDRITEMPKNGIRVKSFWMKCDISKKNILKQSTEMWNEHISGAHELGIIMNICGKYPPNKLGS